MQQVEQEQVAMSRGPKDPLGYPLSMKMMKDEGEEPDEGIPRELKKPRGRREHSTQPLADPVP